MKDNCPLVSISCITYNHAPYIRQCLDGFMMQQTNFAFEVLIHDDASTDGTTEIIKEYEEKYPDIIKPLYEEENQWVKGRRGSAVFNFPRATGKYIAMCEGDDYWTDPLKLQKQVDFLEANPEYVMCSHCVNEYDQELNIISEGWSPHNNIRYNKFDLLSGGWYYYPLSVVFRHSALDLKGYNRYPYHMDAVLFYHLLEAGGGYLLRDKMGVYRNHIGGVWSKRSLNQRCDAEFKARLGIYEIEHSYDAAFYIKTQFFKPMSRHWMLKEHVIMRKSLRIIYDHFGLWKTIKVLVKGISISTR